MQLLLISDPLLNEYGTLRPVVLLSKELNKNHDIFIASLEISEPIREKLEAQGIKLIDLGVKFFSSDWFIMWSFACFPELLFKTHSKKLKKELALDQFKTLKFSSMVAIPADIWYGQGLISTTLSAVASEMPWYYKNMFKIIKPVISYLDKKLIIDPANSSRIVIANSQFCTKLYETVGINIQNVIGEPLDCEIYKPSTSKPSSDYVLTYIGKETNFSLIKRVADNGIHIKAFGAKVSYTSPYIRGHPNIELLGHVSEKRLIDLYSNAYYTLFPFTDEPFGYIPVESMACGTPVLTYGRQGPSETVIDGLTGWLVHDDNDMINLAKKLERTSYSALIRKSCRKRGLSFDIKKIAKDWSKFINTL